jgi:hypothetical protein
MTMDMSSKPNLSILSIFWILFSHPDTLSSTSSRVMSVSGKPLSLTFYATPLLLIRKSNCFPSISNNSWALLESSGEVS